MGKANRIKNEKAASMLAAPLKRPSAKKSMPTWVGTLIVVAVLVALILAVTLSVLSSRGTFMRMRVIAETENYEITVPMMSYMIYTEYQNLVSQYSNLSSQIGTTLSIPGGKGGAALVQGSPLRDQIYRTQDDNGNAIETETWFDRFAYLACEDLKEILACCEYALDKGIELEEKELLEIETSLSNLQLYAAYYGYTTDGYLNAMYGRGVRLKDVRAMMELSTLAAKVSEQREKELHDAVGDDRVNTQYTENQKTYDIYIDYLSYTFTATFTPSTNKDTTAAATENETMKAEYEAKQEKYAAYVAELNACETAEAFNTKLTSILQEVFYEEEIKAAEDALKDGETLTDEKKEECRTKANERVVEAIEDANTKNGKTSDLGTEEKKWMTAEGDDARKEGDHTTFESVYDVYGKEVKKEESSEGGADAQADETKEFKKATSTYSVYFVNSKLHRDESVVRSVGHILFKTATFKDVKDVTKLSATMQKLATRILKREAKISSEEMAKELLLLMKEEGKLTEKTVDGRTYYEISEADFNAYGLTYTEDSNVFYNDVTVGQMVEPFEDWLMDPSRVVGEISDGGIETTYGHHVMFYKGDEQPAWSYAIREELSQKDYDNWLKETKEANAASFSEKDSYWNMITG